MFPTSLLLQQISLIIHFVLEKTKETTFVSQMTKIWRDDIWAALPSFVALKAHNFVSWLTKSWSVSCETSAPVFVFYVTKSPYIVDRKGTCPIIITFTRKGTYPIIITFTLYSWQMLHQVFPLTQAIYFLMSHCLKIEMNWLNGVKMLLQMLDLLWW
jgi:hypothetical protein